MIPNPKDSLSAFSKTGNYNPMSFAIGEHYEARDAAIRKLVELYHSGYDLNDNDLFYSVLSRYGILEDGFTNIKEIEYITKKVIELITT